MITFFGFMFLKTCNGFMFSETCKPEFSVSGPLVVSDQQLTSSTSVIGGDATNARIRPVHASPPPSS